MHQPSLPPSHVIADKYVVDRSLGQGGMGAVYLVRHRVTGKQLALKCLLPQFLAHSELVERFLREAHAAGRIEHRHVVDVFDVGQDGDVLYMVMPLLEGKPLSQLLREERLPLGEMLALLLRAMEGVSAAHAQGIVHRDLKPDNIFVCVGPSGRLDDPRVLDFGISKVDSEDQDHPLTRSGVLMGTPHYMSFEQLNGQRDIDARADVYAMGCILYQALAGELPYTADSAPALAIRMMSGPPEHLATRRPDLPPGLADAVMQALARDRDERFPNIEALMQALRPFATAERATPDALAGTAGASTPTALASTVSAEPAIATPRLSLKAESEYVPPRQQGVDWRALRAGAALGAVLLGAAGWWVSQHGASPAAQALKSPPALPSSLPTRAADTHSSDPAEATQGTESSKRTVKRKVRRRKQRASAAPLAPAQVAAGAPGVAQTPDEWEEVEEEVRADEQGALEPTDVAAAVEPALNPPASGPSGSAPGAEAQPEAQAVEPTPSP